MFDKEKRKEWMRTYTKKWYQANKEKKHQYYLDNKEHYAYLGRRRRDEIRLTVLTYYGGGRPACISCNELRLPCLSIDHIKYIGNHSERKSPILLYRRLIKENFPEGFQTLCMNCQFIKREENREFFSK